GADEGVYLEAPLLGPNTTRDLAGRVVNFALDPGFLITVGAVEVGTTIQILDAARTPTTIVTAREENFELIDDIFYESEDSYVAARTGYVQARRRQISGETQEGDLPDIFDE
ncbi:MAG: MlaA family lipoprotein, partial [Pseudomonadota bacterium]